MVSADSVKRIVNKLRRLSVILDLDKDFTFFGAENVLSTEHVGQHRFASITLYLPKKKVLLDFRS